MAPPSPLPGRPVLFEQRVELFGRELIELLQEPRQPLLSAAVPARLLRSAAGLGQPCQRRTVVERAQGKISPQLLAHPRDHLGGEDGVAAELVEVVVEPDRRAREDRTPDPRQALLQRTERLAAGAVRWRGG